MVNIQLLHAWYNCRHAQRGVSDLSIYFSVPPSMSTTSEGGSDLIFPLGCIVNDMEWYVSEQFLTTVAVVGTSCSQTHALNHAEVFQGSQNME